MAKYRKKPVVVDAEQWFKNGDHSQDNCHYDEGKLVRYFRRPDIEGTYPCDRCGKNMHNHGWIDTLEAGHTVCPSDWIIRDVAGEFYPLKPDIFEKTYEKCD